MYELEASVIDSLRSKISCPVYPIGPCVPYMTLEDHYNMPSGKVTSKGDYFNWLDSQPVNSVMYVSLGSFLSASASQLDEIALGLVSSEVTFLWILREQSPRMRQLIGDTDKGMILPWCEQLKVLCHPSVGGFLTHCGMNSTLDSVIAGVPILALPLLFDQPIDCRLIVEEWNSGLNLKDWASEDGLIGREDIARAVRWLMASDEAETKAIRRNALGLKEASRRAVDKGGSSYCNLSSLMAMLLHSNQEFKNSC
jgi:UDP:flavonoid glycosyltransferase YjiC (YdhE family)